MQRRALRPLVVAALLVPAAAFGPAALRDRVDEVSAQRGHARAHALPNLPRDGALLVTTAEHALPAGATFAWVPRGATAASPDLVARQEAYAEGKLARFLAFRLAPRRLVTGAAADWLIVVGATPQAAGVDGVRVVPAGRFRLVQRR
jgi:hypothetical protein